MLSRWLTFTCLACSFGAGGCASVLGIEEQTFDGDAGTPGDAKAGPDGSRADAPAGDARTADARRPTDAPPREAATGNACDIDGSTYASLTPEPSNACKACEPGISTSAWSDVADGKACGDGGICHGGSCASGCEIGGAYYATSALDPMNACASCQPGIGTSSWSNVPDGTSCGDAALCGGGACGSQCDIGSAIVPAGTTSPTNACESCQPATSTSAWTNDADGSACATGEVCSAGTCIASCFIGGAIYAPSVVDSANACESCQPASSTTAWTSIANGTACGTGGICYVGACAGGCYIGGVQYTTNEPNPDNACQSCQPATSTSAWTNVSNGTGCGNGQICASGKCGIQCDIATVTYPSGTTDPMNACASCQPGTSTSAWTNLANGSGCASGKVCNAGSCDSDCFINGNLFVSGQLEPTYPCKSCQPTVSTTAWESIPNGTACPNGEVCSSGACVSDCYIGTELYSSGTPEPGNSCKSCQPATNASTWTAVATGTPCGSDDTKVCSAGACIDDCYIAGNSYPQGTLDPANPCKSCQRTVSISAWTDVSTGTACGADDSEVCNNGSCVDDCYIAGDLYRANTTDPANACESCQPSVSTTAWSPLTTYATCGTGGFCYDGVCAMY